MSYLTLSAAAESELRVSGSRFLAIAAPARTEEDARAVLEERERRYRDATHNCSAWRLHAGVWRANDAGEPSGSAGAPILAAIDGAELLDCVVVVTRYFGGTKLGVGGLIRAYGEAAATALEAAPRRRAVPAARLRVRFPYSHTATVMRLLERHGAEGVEHGYVAGGAEGEVVFLLERTAADPLGRELRDQSSGSLVAEPLGETLIYRPLSEAEAP